MGVVDGDIILREEFIISAAMALIVIAALTVFNGWRWLPQVCPELHEAASLLEREIAFIKCMARPLTLLALPLIIALVIIIFTAVMEKRRKTAAG